MQKLLLSKLASSISKKLSNPSSTSIILHSKPYKTFSSPHHHSPHTSSATKHPFNNFSHFIPSPSSSSRLSQISALHKIRGVFSNPLLSRHFLTSSLLRAPGKSPLKDFKVAYFKGQFSRKSFDLDQLLRTYRYRWIMLLSVNLQFFKKSWFSQISSDNVVLGLIIANVAVFMLWRISYQKFMMRHFTISVDNFESGRVHTMITSAFSHMDVGHLISKMVGLYFFGTGIARYFGPEYLLKLYLAGAIGGSIFYLVHHAFMSSSSKREGLWSMDPSRTPGLGASEAVNAIMLLNIFLFPKATLYFDFIIPVPAVLLGIFLIGQDILRILEGDSRISGSAHLGGAVVAALAWRRVKMGRF